MQKTILGRFFSCQRHKTFYLTFFAHPRNEDTKDSTVPVILIPIILIPIIPIPIIPIPVIPIPIITITVITITVITIKKNGVANANPLLRAL